MYLRKVLDFRNLHLLVTADPLVICLLERKLSKQSLIGRIRANPDLGSI